MTEDNKSASTDRSAGSEEQSDDSDSALRTDGGQTTTSNPTSGSPSKPIEPEGTSSIGGPTTGEPPVDGSTSLAQETRAAQENPLANNGREGANSIVLQPFQELCGRLVEIQRKEHDVILVLSSGALCFPLDSEEARICINAFEGKEGNEVRILRTPDSVIPRSVNPDELARY